jgi:8-oxo-dGTP pyrophosphatase MutT (NUDIX family)
MFRDINRLRNELNKALQNSLPGERAHDELSPPQRLKQKHPPSEGAIEAAVAVVVCSHEKNTHIVVIRRPIYPGVHSGQIAFPGGKRDESDTDLLQTAIRECMEEIGLKLSDEHLLGALTPVYIPVSGFIMHPFVFCMPTLPPFEKDPREVDAVHLIPMKDLLLDERVGEIRIGKEESPTSFTAPCFHFNEATIWGATAIVLNELKHVLRIILEANSRETEGS